VLAREEAEQEVASLDAPSLGGASFVDASFYDASRTRRERQMSTGMRGWDGRVDGSQVDADGRQRRPIESGRGLSRRLEIHIEDMGHQGIRIVEQSEQKVIGADASVATPQRLLDG
jgi:hypothetical protein